MLKHAFPIIATALTMAGLSQTQASVFFSDDLEPQPGDQNILLNNGDTGSEIFGTSNQTGFLVSFSSTTDILEGVASGQSRVEAQDGLINEITISLPGSSFTSLIANPFAGPGGPATISGIANEPGGGTTPFSFPVNFGVGQNFFTLTTGDGETLASVTITSAAGFASLRQNRITPIPDAGSSLLLLGLGMGALGFVRRRA